MRHLKNSNGLIVLLLLMIALAIVVVSFLNAKLNLNNKAAGSGLVKLTISSPSGTSFKTGDTFSLNISLTATQLKQIRAAGADLSFDSNVFSGQSVMCNNSNFPSIAKSTFSGGTISLSCFRPAGASFTLNANQAVTLGTIRLQVRQTAPLGSTGISFLRTKVPEAGASLDISDSGSAVSFSISGSGVCSLKSQGDANCDSKIDVKDFFIWRREFLSGSGKYSDFDQNNLVNIKDFFIWRRGFLNGLSH